MTETETVRALWSALAARDWDAILPLLAADCLYFDVPTTAALAARGGPDIVKRLKVGLAPLTSYTNHDGVIVASGEDVLYEHSETWTFDTGEVAVLPFVTVHKVRDRQITLWKDYWDFTTLQNQAPPDWMQRMAGTDMSWCFDATGLV
jgi:limonene-1,2-epoxide hydrolase